MNKTQEEEKEPLSPEEKALVSKVSKIAAALDKTTKSSKFYLPNNPIVIKHQNDLVEMFADYFSSEKELVLKITANSFVYKNQPVYQNPSKSENFAFKLHSDGIRSITFYEGLSREELLEFMSILNKGLDLKTDSEVDLVTLLWEKQFDNIKYQVVEGIVETSMPDDGKSTEDRIDEITRGTKEDYYGLGEEYKDIIEMEEIPLTYDATNFGEMFKVKGVLQKEELDIIKHEIDLSEKKENILTDFMDILPVIFAEEVSEDEVKKTLGIIRGIVDACIFSGSLSAASQVLKKLKDFPEIIKSSDIPIRKTVEGFIKGISKGEKISELINTLNVSFAGEPEEITQLITELDEISVPALLKSLAEVNDPFQRKAICSGIPAIFKGDPTYFLSFINIKNPEILHDLLFLLSKMNNEKVVDLIPHFISHSDKSIKKESIALLKTYKTNPKATKILLSALDDPDEELRVMTLRTLAVSENRDVAKSLILRISRDDFGSKSLTEKKSYFFATSKISQNEFVPFLTDILETKRWFSKENMDELYQCACFALGIIGTDRAKEVLEKGRHSKNKTIQKNCQAILRKIEMGTS